nr:lipopolysaccharide heptosyltransferase I [Oceanobacter mangrovi]
MLIKTSSLGDVFHTLPALEDARRKIPDLEVDWVVEEAFADIPGWHPAVKSVIPVAWRRWRKGLLKAENRQQMKAFRQRLRAENYDLVLDAQGLIKSAAITWLAGGKSIGLDRDSAREPLASRVYGQKIAVARGGHAIHRLRELFGKALGYDWQDLPFSYGVSRERWQAPAADGAYWLFLHGTTWDTKLWPENYWRELSGLALAVGRKVMLPWGNDEEKARAERIADGLQGVQVLPRMGLNELTAWLAYAEAIVGVDTGLSHVAAALEVPAVAIYGSTNAELTGALGPAMEVLASRYACAPCLSRKCLNPGDGSVEPPCYREISPPRVVNQLQALIAACHDSA